MSQKKKIVIFSPPFNGHLAILKELILDYQKDFDFYLIINGWKNIKSDLSRLDTSKVTILENEELHDTDPTQWTFKRVASQLDQCLEICRKIRPDLVIYDFFSLEGYFVGKILNIPIWCSIPAMIGPFNNIDYRNKKLNTEENKRALNVLNQKYNVKLELNQIEMISDGFHLSGQKNLIWSFQSLVPTNFKENRKNTEYIFIGNLRGDNYVPYNNRDHIPHIYFSLGTVIMGNNWKQQKELRIKLRDFVSRLAQLWQNKGYTITFVTQGKKVLENYPANWNVIKHANQVKELSHSEIFITHGGNNSFHEAVLQKVPIIILPFFGDQPLIAEQASKLGIGINLIENSDIDTKKSKDFLSDELAIKVDDAVTEILKNNRFKIKMNSLNLDYTPIKNLLDKC